jgi:hypothetical protein
LAGAQNLLKSLFWAKKPFITTDTGCLTENQTRAYLGRATFTESHILIPRGLEHHEVKFRIFLAKQLYYVVKKYVQNNMDVRHLRKVPNKPT